ncbi:5'-nucleotidase C-terminal domain-containing protein [Bacillus licheniformis]|nr:5'-nucleotidase C-terminal domain-containing protein [Bacillus licheniformis]
MSAQKKPTSAIYRGRHAEESKQAGGADIAITNGGGIRSGIAKGEITLGDVLTVMPFGNTLYAADLTGAQIKEALEHGVSQVEEGGGAFPHVSGLSFTFTLSKPKVSESLM